jgi:hypothetical protein
LLPVFFRAISISAGPVSAHPIRGPPALS